MQKQLRLKLKLMQKQLRLKLKLMQLKQNNKHNKHNNNYNKHKALMQQLCIMLLFPIIIILQ